MAYKGFYYNIIVRIILLVLSSFWLSICIKQPEKIYSLAIALSILIIQIIALINYINKTNRDLARFFASLKDKDSSTHLNFSNTKGALKELGATLNEISELISKSRIESEKQSKYFEFVVEHVPIGILTINSSGKIIHLNRAIKELLHINSAITLDKISSIYSDLGTEINKIKPGEQKIIRMKILNQFEQILIRTTQFKFENEELKLVSLQNVKNELEENELVSWQKLIRVLTHEIMNSITPISTLTLATKKCLNINNKPIEIEQINSETIHDVLKNTQLIEERSAGLQTFVERYRSLTKIQALKTIQFSVKELLNKIVILFNDEIQKNKISVTVLVLPENLMLEADEKLIEQVLINLMKNAIESFKNNPIKTIHLESYLTNRNRVEIVIRDSGNGISDELIDKIFIPFYTTKEQGSGIGLSLARQIMRLHSGSISVQSVPNIETVFTLAF